jgi:thiamine biosynthesis protein ThiS
MDLIVNGKPHLHLGGGSIAELLDEIGAKPAMTAVIINSEVVPRSRWAAVRLNEHSKVELLVMAAGG